MNKYEITWTPKINLFLLLNMTYKPKREYIDYMEDKYWWNLFKKYKSDRELFRVLREWWFPSLVALLKMTWTKKK